MVGFRFLAIDRAGWNACCGSYAVSEFQCNHVIGVYIS